MVPFSHVFPGRKGMGMYGMEEVPPSMRSRELILVTVYPVLKQLLVTVYPARK